MTVTLIKTRAEQQLAEQFAAVEVLLPKAGPLGSERRSAMAEFGAAGLPHRRIEEWKYTDLRVALKEALPPARPSWTLVTRAAIDKALGLLADVEADRLVFVDGFHVTALSSIDDANEMTVASRAPGPDWLSGTDGPMNALNAAFATDGAVVRLPNGRASSKPLVVVFVSTAETAQRVTTRNSIEVGRGSLTVIEAHVRIGAAKLQTSTAMRIRLGSGASVQHIKAVLEGESGTHLSSCDVEIGTGASYRGFQLSAGTGLERNTLSIAFTGPNAKLDLTGLMLGRNASHIDTTLVVDHATPGCESRELYKAVLDGHARGVFQGKIMVQPIAQKTDGKQMAKALMLSEDAEFDSKPELEIYADDVVCGHGSTVAEIDPAMMFYLQSRGIPKTEARAMLIESFVGEAIDKIEDAAVREALMQMARRWLTAD